MSLEKRFKILPARTGYEKLLISSDRKKIHKQIKTLFFFKVYVFRDFLGDTVDKNLLANAGDITNSTFENKR